MGPDGAFITGSDFLIDGGVTASYFYGELAPSDLEPSPPTMRKSLPPKAPRGPSELRGASAAPNDGEPAKLPTPTTKR